MRSGLSVGKLLRLARQAVGLWRDVEGGRAGHDQADGRRGRTSDAERGTGRAPRRSDDGRGGRVDGSGRRRDRPAGGTTSSSVPPREVPSREVPSREVPSSTDSEFHGARIEYSPSMDGDPDPGEVVWTWVPYEDDPSQGKDRPVVIIGRRGSGLVGVALTSKRHDNEPQLDVGTGSWDREGRPSYAKLERVLDVDPAQVRREGAVLAEARFDELVAALRRLHGLVERPR